MRSESSPKPALDNLRRLVCQQEQHVFLERHAILIDHTIIDQILLQSNDYVHAVTSFDMYKHILYIHTYMHTYIHTYIHTRIQNIN